MYVYLFGLVSLVGVVLIYQVIKAVLRHNKGRLVTHYKDCPSCHNPMYSRPGQPEVWVCDREHVCFLE